MKRTTLFLLLLLLLVGGYFFFSKSSTELKMERLAEDRKFVVDDIDEVKKIFIAYRDKPSVTLTKEKDKWRLDEKYDANPYVMEGILEVLKRARIQFVPTEAEVESTLPVLAAKGIKIEAYDKNDEKLLGYYIGGVTQNEKGTHFFKEGADKTFVMELPYGETNIRQRFEIRYDDWKTRLIFADRIEEIKSVKVDYPKAPTHGYVIERKEDEFTIRPSVLDQPKNAGELKPSVFEKYLVTFKGVNYAEFINEAVVKDSVLATPPFMTTELVNVHNDTARLALWPKRALISTPMQAHDKGQEYFSYFALNNHGDFGTVQHHVVRGTIGGYDGFFK